MTTITTTQKGPGIEAIQTFALSISQGDSFLDAFEAGSDFVDNLQDEESFTLMAISWKVGLLKVEVKKMLQDGNGEIIDWKTELV